MITWHAGAGIGSMMWHEGGRMMHGEGQMFLIHMHEPKYLSIECQNVGLQVAGMRVCEFVMMRVCGFVGMQECTFVGCGNA
jgi:hypothetical protein